MSVTFAGLSSGLDTTSLINQLVAVERAPATAIAGHQQDLNTQKSIVGSLSAAVAALGTALGNMNLASQLQPRTASASDGHVTVATSDGAAATVHDVRVGQLARGQITGSRTFTTQAAGALAAGSLTITTAGAAHTISYDATDSLSAIAGKINGAAAGATASVLFDGTTYRLMVAATATGTAAAPQFTETGDALGLADPANVKVAAQDAKVNIDGVDVTRGSNVIGDAATGVTFTLNSAHAATDPATHVTIALDTASVRDKLKAMVSAYNGINGALHVQLDYTGTTKGTDTLFGDPTLRQLQGALGTLMSSSYGPTTLGALGLTRAKDGSLTLDETKLASALTANPNAVADVFVTGGFAAAGQKMTDAYSRSGDGILASKTQSLSDRFTTLQKQSDQINARADALQTQLEAQFTALETAMTSLKNESAYITRIFG
jgi:flagellar hook-associated protein 2